MSEEVTEVVEETPAVTRPARTKSAVARRASEPKKAVKAKVAPETVESEDEEDEEPAPTPIRLTITQTGETPNYAVFQLPRTGSDGNKSVVCGTIYAPKGTRTVKVLVVL